ncbi:MAG: MBL fold metallo-hydrolase [Gammaproteobacteria bacterium]
MRFSSLGSGSRGNATLVEKGDTCVMVDCGFSLRETVRRLARLGKRPEDLTAILVTHEHSDHLGGVGLFAGKYAVPVWATEGTAVSLARDKVPAPRLFAPGEPFAIGELEIHPFPVSHDAREPAQFVFSDGQRRLGLLTDTGNISAEIEWVLRGCDALLLECNHDPGMLADGRYPAWLKQRVAGDFGHLSNEQAAAFLRRTDTARLQHVVAMHLSEQNNCPSLAVRALSAALGCTMDWIGVADQRNGLAWRELG